MEEITEHKLPLDIILQDVAIHNKNEIIFEERAYVHGNKCKIEELSCETSKNLSRLILIQKDLEECKEYLLYIQKHEKGESENKANTLNENIVVTGLYKSFSISYGKCFSSSTIRGSLVKKKVFKNQKKQLKTHTDVINLRNNYFAHAGNSSAEIPYTQLITGINRDKKLVKHIFSKTVKFSRSSYHSLEEEIELVEYVMSYVSNEIAGVFKKLQQDYHAF